MLFHVGALWRLNELGWLPRLDRVSSVSGGSITAGVLGFGWSRLVFDAGGVAGNLDEVVVAPVRALAGWTIDVPSVIRGLLGRGTVASRAAAAYRKHLFGAATLQRLPDRPRFVINATNLQTGTLWRFSKPYMADYQIGMIQNPDVALAVAVAASAAFPPVLSPLRLSLRREAFAADGRGELFRPPFTEEAVLSDGGVYDNLGLETAWKRYLTVLVSDGGGHMEPAGEIPGDWVRASIRVGSVVDNQVRSLRKRQVAAAFLAGDRSGAYWGIRGNIAEVEPLPGALPCPREQTSALAAVATRLSRMEPVRQQRLINWGYAAADEAMRRWVVLDAPAPAGFPYPSAGVG
ncbi:patatin-like phospholipase family protein [Actinoplanes sp. TBRC 11911]|nr:patatin-like phospholipase family protein [Actinoplanes sp. TBRC 11911]